MAPAKILFVDDEIDLQRLIKQRFRRQIESEELDFIFASNGIEALRKLRQDEQIDMVLTDLNMPGMDGLTFIHFLSKINETLKAVVITAYDDMSRIRQAMNEGAYDFLTKPINFQDLEETIEKTLRFVRELKAKQQQNEQFQEELRQAAFHDALTSLPNRAWLYNHLTRILKRREETNKCLVALLFIDLDGFKKINDTLGHLTGDNLLRNVAKRLQASLREGDFAARYGGDEFVIILEGIADISIATCVADRIINNLMEPFYLDQQNVTIGASIGIAVDQQNYKNPEEFIQEADIAMYAAKAQGKGCHVVLDNSAYRN